MPAYWTEQGSDKVVKIHNNPEDVDTSQADIISDTKPDSPKDLKPWKQTELHYNETDGFYYVTENPFEGLPLSDSEKMEILRAVEDRDLVKAREIIERALNS